MHVGHYIRKSVNMPLFCWRQGLTHLEVLRLYELVPADSIHQLGNHQCVSTTSLPASLCTTDETTEGGTVLYKWLACLMKGR